MSPIFKWYREEFEKGPQGFNRIEDVFAQYATQLSEQPGLQARLRERALRVTFLDDDWALNASGR